MHSRASQRTGAWRLPWLLAVVACVALQGCASHGALQTARDHYRLGNGEQALDSLDPASLSRRDQLLGWLDRGLIAHMGGEYEISRDAFFEARALLDTLDKVSVSEQTSAVLVSDWATSYRGEYSEQLWIHAFQMMNFLLLEQTDGAAVEARQALEVLAAHPEPLAADRFTRSLIALSFAAAGQFDSAAIELTRLHDDYPDDPDIASLAARVAQRAGRSDDARRLAGPDGGILPATGDGELVVLISSGRIAEKRAGDLFVSPTTRLSFPFYPPVISRLPIVTASRDGEALPVRQVAIETTDVSRRALEARGKVLATRQALRASGKYALGQAAGDQDEALGLLVKTLLVLLEQADTRSWATLPGQLSLLRIDLPAGRHDVRLAVDDGLGIQEVLLEGVEVDRRRTAFERVHLGTP